MRDQLNFEAPKHKYALWSFFSHNWKSPFSREKDISENTNGPFKNLSRVHELLRGDEGISGLESQPAKSPSSQISKKENIISEFIEGLLNLVGLPPYNYL